MQTLMLGREKAFRRPVKRSKSTITAKAYRKYESRISQEEREERLIMPGHYGKMKKPKAKNKKLAGMYGNKSKITRGDIIAAAKKRKKRLERNGR